MEGGDKGWTGTVKRSIPGGLKGVSKNLLDKQGGNVGNWKTGI